MEIKFEVDEAKVIKMVMDGLNSKAIHEQIVGGVMEVIEDKIADKMTKGNKWIPPKRVIDSIEKSCVNLAKKYLQTVMEDKVESRLYDYNIQDAVDEYLTNMIEEQFAVSPVSIEFKYKNKKVGVDVLAEKKRK